MDELLPLLSALVIHDPMHYAFAGHSFTVTHIPTATDPAPPPVMAIAATLYQQGYCRRFRGKVVPPPMATESPSADLIAQCRAHLHTQSGWSEGWTVIHPSANGQVYLWRGGQTLLAGAGEYVIRDGAGVRQGAIAALWRARDAVALQEGYYHGFGETVSEFTRAYGVVRFYFNLSSPANAVQWLARLSTHLNHWHIPFHLKCATLPSMYDRADSAVLYVHHRYAPITVSLLQELSPVLQPLLATDTPLFTYRLFDGIAFAEEPHTTSNDSFGSHRCRLVAQGVWQAFLMGQTDPVAQLAAVETVFEGEGVRREMPFLRPDSDPRRYPFLRTPEAIG